LKLQSTTLSESAIQLEHTKDKHSGRTEHLHTISSSESDIILII